MGLRAAGTAYVKVDGTQYPLRGNLVIMPSSVTRTGIAGQDYVHGYSEMPVVPYIEGDFTLTDDWKISDVKGITGATVTAEIANGHTYTLKNAWQAGDLPMETVDGKVKIRFEGVSCTEGT
ncbi:phage tail tube protein [Rhizobium sp. BR 317]|uniref:phage tail tube protein n=1 Tax=Rhizobium sp. BR 317 TaxID=3040015 RepID=UPI0039BED2BB